MTGLSRSNLQYGRALAAAWPANAHVPQAAGHLPWGHIRLSKNAPERRCPILAFFLANESSYIQGNLIRIDDARLLRGTRTRTKYSVSASYPSLRWEQAARRRRRRGNRSGYEALAVSYGSKSKPKSRSKAVMVS